MKSKKKLSKETTKELEKFQIKIILFFLGAMFMAIIGFIWTLSYENLSLQSLSLQSISIGFIIGIAFSIFSVILILNPKISDSEEE